MPTMSTLFDLFSRPAARRLGAAVIGSALLSGSVLAAEPATARANPSTLPLHMLGSFHLKRVEVTSSVTEAGTLLCTSASGGTPTDIHGMGALKDPTAACKELAAVNGDFTRLVVHPTWLPPTLPAPVDVEARGTWNGAQVAYSREFTNDGWMLRQTGDVFVF